MKSRKAFTLIEVLTVVAIVALVIGMATIGYRSFNASAGSKATRGTLEICRSMLTEYEAQAGGLSKLVYTPANVTIVAPGNVTDGQTDRVGAAVISTRQIMNQLIAIPQAKAIMQRLPSETTFTFALTPGDPLEKVPVLLDAWHNPILFVPSEGFTGIQSGGQVIAVKKAPDGRPFFASSGPDGDFAKGDDNLYSFEN